MVKLPPNPLKMITGAIHDVTVGAAKVDHAVLTHPIESIAIGGTIAALAVGAVFTGGADLAAAPEVVGGELAAVSGVDAASVAVSGADAAAADSAATTPGLLSGVARTIGGAGSKLINGFAKGAAGALKFGLPLGGIGIGLSYLSQGIANTEQSFLNGVSPTSYGPSPLGLVLGQSPTGTLTSQTTGTTTTGTPTSLFSSTAFKILLLLGGAFVLYEVVKHK